MPRECYGAGLPRTRRMVQTLARMGCRVTYYAILAEPDGEAPAEAALPPDIEAAASRGGEGLGGYLQERADGFDAVIVSRPHNMALLIESLKPRPDLLAGVRLIYDAECLFTLREQLHRKVDPDFGRDGPDPLTVEQELALARPADYVIAVSPSEAERFRGHGFRNVGVVSHHVDAAPTPAAFSERKGLLFLGAMYDASNPNADSMFWFLREIWPRIRQRLGPEIGLTIAGMNTDRILGPATGPATRVLGRVDSTGPLFNEARVFVIPTRFEAGIPLKALEAAARGLPMVATSLIAGQLGWKPRELLWVADDPVAFAEACIELHGDMESWYRLRKAALARVESDFSAQAFESNLRASLGPAAPGRSRRPALLPGWVRPCG
jgi:glycosyltransferase involved in cell wall biosynthesis